MPRLCSESSRPYPGRSVRLGHVSLACMNNQSGHWFIKPGRMGMLLTHASE
jgi:hypothetical protein